jgi:hypothetical protein
MLGHPVGILAKPKFARTGSRNESSKAAHILDSGRVSFSPFEKNTAGMTLKISILLERATSIELATLSLGS